MEHIRISYLYSHMTFKLVFRVVGWMQIMRIIDDIRNYKLTHLFYATVYFECSMSRNTSYTRLISANMSQLHKK